MSDDIEQVKYGLRHAMGLLEKMDKHLEKAEARYQATREACEELGAYFGAEIRWDSEGMPGLTLEPGGKPDE